MSWSISPFIYELAPAVAEWYYDQATEDDYFTAPPSGIGNMYPSLFPYLSKYNEKLAQILPLLDLTETWFWNFPDQGNTSLAQQILRESGLRAVFENAPELIVDLEDGLYVGSRMIIVSDEISDEHRVGKILDEIMARRAGRDKPTFVCVYLATFRVNPSLVYDVATSLGDEYEVVGLMEFIRLLEGPGLNVMALDRWGRPLRSCKIVAKDPSGKMLADQTDQDGMSSFYVEPGDFSIKATWKGAVVNQTTFTLGEENSISLLCDVSDLSVSINDGLGLPAPGSRATLYSSEMAIVAEGRSNGLGSISFPQIPHGEYLLAVTSLGLETEHEFTFDGANDMSFGVYLSIYSLALYAIACFAFVMLLLFLRPRIAPRPKEAQPPIVTQLSLEMEYEEIMSEIRMRELALGKDPST
jgi:hypothetical protein